MTTTKRHWKITITGRPISKKNSKRIFRSNTRRGVTVLPSVGYERFKNDAIAQITDAGKHPYFTVPVGITCTFHLKGKISADGDNLFTSILDILCDALVLKDDDLVHMGIFYKESGHKEFSTEITVAEL